MSDTEPNGQRDDPQGSVWQRIWPHTRWLRPSMLALAGLCFFLPFVSVSCDAPGGFGRVDAGGTTSYTGFDLAFGGEPTRSPDQLLPPGEGFNDLIGLQPAIIVGLVLLVGALVCSLVINRPAARNVTVAALALATVLALGIAQLQAHNTLTDMLAEQLKKQNLPSGAGAGDYVRVGTGFTGAMVALGLVVLGEFTLIGLRMRALKPAAGQDAGLADRGELMFTEEDPLAEAPDLPSPPPVTPPEDAPPEQIVPGTGPEGLLPGQGIAEPQRQDPEPPPDTDGEPRRASDSD